MTSPLVLRAGEVHVWLLRAAQFAQPPETLEQILAPDELERAARFEFPEDRLRFVMGRGVVKRLLGQYLNVDARQLRFEYGPHGKPNLPAGQNPAGLRFNVSHSAGIVAMAFTVGREVGIDIECVRQLENSGRLARQVFAPEEYAAWSSLGSDEKQEALFVHWTRSEALSKGLGLGWAMFQGQHGRPALNAGWEVRDLKLLPGYTGAVAVEGPGAVITYLAHRAGETMAPLALKARDSDCNST